MLRKTLLLSLILLTVASAAFAQRRPPRRSTAGPSHRLEIGAPHRVLLDLVP